LQFETAIKSADSGETCKRSYVRDNKISGSEKMGCSFHATVAHEFKWSQAIQCLRAAIKLHTAEIHIGCQFLDSIINIRNMIFDKTLDFIGKFLIFFLLEG
jgi:hypothetical protein